MAICNGCNGVLGIDCFNTQECQQIAASMASQSSYDEGYAAGLEAARASLPSAQPQEPDINKCPSCGGEADNGHDRCYPPNPYYCTKCTSAQPSDVVTRGGYSGVLCNEVNIAFVGYNPDELQLRVEYTNGNIYDYSDVPQRVWDDLRKSECKGRHLGREIKGNYRYYRVNGD